MQERYNELLLRYEKDKKLLEDYEERKHLKLQKKLSLKILLKL